MKWRLKDPRSGQNYEARLLESRNGQFKFEVNGEKFWISASPLWQKEQWSEADWRASYREHIYQLENLSRLKSGQDNQAQIRSQMPGRVLKVLCREGESVQAEQRLFIIEAMKMENEIRVSESKKVKTIHVTEGQSIESGQILIEFEETEASA